MIRLTHQYHHAYLIEKNRIFTFIFTTRLYVSFIIVLQQENSQQSDFYLQETISEKETSHIERFTSIKSINL